MRMFDLNHSRNLARPPRDSDFRIMFLLALSIVGLTCRVTAQTFTTLHSFTARPSPPCPCPNSDGAYPMGLALSGSTLYGTAGSGGSGGWGTVFSLNTDGTGFTTLYDGFGSFADSPIGLTLSGSILYGTTHGIGGDWGTLFAVKTDGTSFSPLYSFTAYCGDGAGPSTGVILSGSTLYGTQGWGTGGACFGTVFAVNNDGSGFTNLYTFTQPTIGQNPNSLVLSGDILYGTTSDGGNFRPCNCGHAGGTVFKINTDGTGFKTLHQFAVPIQISSTSIYTNSDGANPSAGLVFSGSTLYGTTSQGGTSGYGTVFAVNSDGTGFKTLHTFSSDYIASITPRNLIVSGSALYGVTGYPDNIGFGSTVFKLNTDGSGFTTLYYFTALQNTNSDGILTNSDGTAPTSLILSGNTLYGTAERGGIFGSGTIFSISLLPTPPKLTITPVGPNVILSWPISAAGFTLQSSSNLGPSAVWITNSSPPFVINNQFTVTNPISGTQQFYRLAQ